MEKSIANTNVEKVCRQRNLFVFLTLVLGVCSCFLSIKLMRSSEKTILVPGLNSEFWISDFSVSDSYLQATTLMYLSILLDLDPQTIEAKSKLVFQYVSNTNSQYVKQIQQYFAIAQEKYKQFDLSTYFSVKNFVLDTKNLVVVANGTLTSKFGASGLQTETASYKISYENVLGQLRIKEFFKVKK